MAATSAIGGLIGGRSDLSQLGWRALLQMLYSIKMKKRIELYCYFKRKTCGTFRRLQNQFADEFNNYASNKNEEIILSKSSSQDFLFATNSDIIDGNIANNLDVFILTLEKHHKVLLGLMDMLTKGEDNYNLELSTRRAEAVSDYLVEKGIERERIVIRSFGENKSISSIDDLNAHEKERRVTVQLDESMLSDENEISEDTLAKIN